MPRKTLPEFALDEVFSYFPVVSRNIPFLVSPICIQPPTQFNDKQPNGLRLLIRRPKSEDRGSRLPALLQDWYKELGVEIRRKFPALETLTIHCTCADLHINTIFSLPEPTMRELELFPNACNAFHPIHPVHPSRDVYFGRWMSNLPHLTTLHVPNISITQMQHIRTALPFLQKLSDVHLHWNYVPDVTHHRLPSTLTHLNVSIGDYMVLYNNSTDDLCSFLFPVVGKVFVLRCTYATSIMEYMRALIESILLVRPSCLERLNIDVRHTDFDVREWVPWTIDIAPQCKVVVWQHPNEETCASVYRYDPKSKAWSRGDDTLTPSATMTWASQ